MSYIEKAFYRYLKSIFTTGIKVFLSKRYRLFTIPFLFVSFFSTLFFLISQYGSVSFLPFHFLFTLLFYIELSIAVNYILYGVFLSQYPKKYWGIPIIITSGVFVFLLYFLPHVTAVIIMLCYLLWIVLSVFLTFSVSRNFWGNKVLGSIMFLGKKSDEGSILFAPIVLMVALINGGIAGYILWVSINSNRLLFFLTGIFALIGVILVFVTVIKLGKDDDVFYTILSFFYVGSSWPLWKFVFYLFRGTPSASNLTSLIGVFFLLFYTFSTYGRKVKTIHSNIHSTGEKERDCILIKFPKYIGAKGTLMCIQGLILGYHVSYFQFASQGTLFFPIWFFSGHPLAWIHDTIVIIFSSVLFLFFLAYYRWSSSFQQYVSPELYRFAFLPPFEELVEKLEEIQKGDTSWKTYTLQILKEATKIGLKSAREKAVSSAKNITKFAKKIFQQEEEK